MGFSQTIWDSKTGKKEWATWYTCMDIGYIAKVLRDTAGRPKKINPISVIDYKLSGSLPNLQTSGIGTRVEQQFLLFFFSQTESQTQAKGRYHRKHTLPQVFFYIPIKMVTTRSMSAASVNNHDYMSPEAIRTRLPAMEASFERICQRRLE